MPRKSWGSVHLQVAFVDLLAIAKVLLSISEYNIKIMVFDIQREEILQWIN
ncbi:hypothetical protein VB774_22220 [Pseudanabaena galeata UHCC 0370]|uniref:FdxN element excision controlling factor protein n=1 Tax=Pseudanabaena galeata UHCC 0370 TaxID=3110310 RepID=A0ABU5TQ02_9CYAN|nr:hypothetical protein [Pseudanabaena galeata]MEA5480359.1 hypothetical protein [Pseudanabaena galeata UHCC 0370]